MKTIVTLAGILIFTNVIGQDLKSYKWKERVLLIQTSSETSDEYQKQIKEFSEWENELKERKLVFYAIVGDTYKLTNYNSKKTNNSWRSTDGLFDDLIDKKDDFRVLLIGLDGGIKLNQTTVLRRSELFKIIDSMPMRMQELRGKRN